jgi:hypothetical protein
MPMGFHLTTWTICLCPDWEGFNGIGAEPGGVGRKEMNIGPERNFDSFAPAPACEGALTPALSRGRGSRIFILAQQKRLQGRAPSPQPSSEGEGAGFSSSHNKKGCGRLVRYVPAEPPFHQGHREDSSPPLFISVLML